MWIDDLITWDRTRDEFVFKIELVSERLEYRGVCVTASKNQFFDSSIQRYGRTDSGAMVAHDAYPIQGLAEMLKSNTILSELMQFSQTTTCVRTVGLGSQK